MEPSENRNGRHGIFRRAGSSGPSYRRGGTTSSTYRPGTTTGSSLNGGSSYRRGGTTSSGSSIGSTGSGTSSGSSSYRRGGTASGPTTTVSPSVNNNSGIVVPARKHRSLFGQQLLAEHRVRLPGRRRRIHRRRTIVGRRRKLSEIIFGRLPATTNLEHETQHRINQRTNYEKNKFVTLCVIAALPFATATAQTPGDLLNLSQYNYSFGTARSAALGGAFHIARRGSLFDEHQSGRSGNLPGIGSRHIAVADLE